MQLNSEEMKEWGWDEGSVWRKMKTWKREKIINKKNISEDG